MPLAGYARASTDDAWQRAADIARNVKPPPFPDRGFVVTAFGADAEGRKLSTTAINQAIDRCSAEGGGRVIVPQAPVNDVTLRDCSFDGVTQPSIIKYTRTVNLEKVRVNQELVSRL